MRSSAPSSRRARTRESYQSAAECIGTIVPKHSVFASTRGQFSMIDAVQHAVAAAAPATISLWTWTVAEYEVQCLESLQHNSGVVAGRLIIDEGARKKNAQIIANWKTSFGPESVRYVRNHAKIATVEGNGLRICLRGSMNLNHNPRFEQLDVTEGGQDFDLVRQIEDELPILRDDASGKDAYAATKLSKAFDSETIQAFAGLKVWAK